MNELLSLKRINKFETLLAAYRKAGVDLGDGLDGGAGNGSTATSMLKYLDPGAKVYAFEPFNGNHRFFTGRDPRIILIPKALAEQEKKMAFHVGSVVAADSVWGQKGLTGYSSVGHLAESRAAGDEEVDCVRGDAVINSRVGFVKLDLQGGEYNALRGLTSILPETRLMWCEYMGKDDRLAPYLTALGFMLFDTEYFFVGEPTEQAREIFHVSRENAPLSTGKTAWFGYKKTPWKDFDAQFAQYKKDFTLVQTDLVCVNKAYVNDFLRALALVDG